MKRKFVGKNKELDARRIEDLEREIKDVEMAKIRKEHSVDGKKLNPSETSLNRCIASKLTSLDTG